MNCAQFAFPMNREFELPALKIRDGPGLSATLLSPGVRSNQTNTQKLCTRTTKQKRATGIPSRDFGFHLHVLCLLLFIPKTRQKSRHFTISTPDHPKTLRHFKGSATEIRLRPIPGFPTFPGFPRSRKSKSPANRKLSHISHFLCALALNFPAEPESNQTFGHFNCSVLFRFVPPEIFRTQLFLETLGQTDGNAFNHQKPSAALRAWENRYGQNSNPPLGSALRKPRTG